MVIRHLSCYLVTSEEGVDFQPAKFIRILFGCSGSTVSLTYVGDSAPLAMPVDPEIDWRAFGASKLFLIFKL